VVEVLVQLTDLFLTTQQTRTSLSTEQMEFVLQRNRAIVCVLPLAAIRGPTSKGRGREGRKGDGRGKGREGKGRGGEKGEEGRGERTGREGVHNLRKTTPPRHQMAGYGPVL